MAVTASAWTLSRWPPARPRFCGGPARRRVRAQAALRSRQKSIDLPPRHIVDYVSRFTASHRATHEEVGPRARAADLYSDQHDKSKPKGHDYKCPVRPSVQRCEYDREGHRPHDDYRATPATDTAQGLRFIPRGQLTGRRVPQAVLCHPHHASLLEVFSRRPNAALQLRRAIAFKLSGTNLLEKHGIAPSVA